MATRYDEFLYPRKREPRNVWERTGLTRRQRRVLDISLYCLLGIFSVGWIYAAATAIARGESPLVARQIGATGSPLASTTPPDASYTLAAIMGQFVDWEEVRGASGAIQLVIQEPGDTLALPDSLPEGAQIAYTPPSGAADSAVTVDAGAPDRPGIWNLMVRMHGAIRAVPELSVVTLIPSSALRGGRIGNYRIGEWPAGRTGAYAAPSGFIEVTPKNMNTQVSRHFQLRDFLTKGQEGVWPKYVVLSPTLLDKLELTLQELERMGHPVENVFVVSGFRTPWYNEAGGNPQGRGAMSRHMYGDAADIAIDNDGDNCMDDLNGDGRVDIADARIIVEAAERVEQRHPNLVGGIGIYRPNPGAHCGMVHIDTRGSRARW
jgi:hypothetical protein